MTEDKFENSPKTGEEINRVFKIQKIKVGKEATAPSQRRFALARIIVCCGASIVAHFARKVRATNT